MTDQTNHPLPLNGPQQSPHGLDFLKRPRSAVLAPKKWLHSVM